MPHIGATPQQSPLDDAIEVAAANSAYKRLAKWAGDGDCVSVEQVGFYMVGIAPDSDAGEDVNLESKTPCIGVWNDTTLRDEYLPRIVLTWDEARALAVALLEVTAISDRG